MCPPAVRTAGLVTPAAAHRVSVLRSIPRARAAAPVVTNRRSGVSLMPSWSHLRLPASAICIERTACNVLRRTPSLASFAPFATFEQEVCGMGKLNRPQPTVIATVAWAAPGAEARS